MSCPPLTCADRSTFASIGARPRMPHRATPAYSTSRTAGTKPKKWKKTWWVESDKGSSYSSNKLLLHSMARLGAISLALAPASLAFWASCVLREVLNCWLVIWLLNLQVEKKERCDLVTIILVVRAFSVMHILRGTIIALRRRSFLTKRQQVHGCRGPCLLLKYLTYMFIQIPRRRRCRRCGLW